MIDSEPEYEISQVTNSKFDYRNIYKSFYKVIMLKYKNTEEEFD